MRRRKLGATRESRRRVPAEEVGGQRRQSIWEGEGVSGEVEEDRTLTRVLRRKSERTRELRDGAMARERTCTCVGTELEGDGT
jgi:hypothetical protein